MPQLLGKVGLGWGMTIIAGILVIVAIWTLIGIKNTPEEAGEYPDGDPTYAVNGAEIAKMIAIGYSHPQKNDAIPDGVASNKPIAGYLPGTTV